MRLPSGLVTLLTNTIQPTKHSLKSTLRHFNDRQRESTSSAQTETHGADIVNTNLNDTPSLMADICKDTIVIAVIGQRHIGKSSLLQHGLNSSTIPQEAGIPPLGYVDVKSIQSKDIQQHSIMLEPNSKTNLRHVIFLEIDHDPLENDLTTTSVHAALICYDVTQLQSMTGVPDLLNLYHSHHQLPVLLLGLKSDLTSCRQVDSFLGKQLAQQHSVPFYEMKTTNALDMQQVLVTIIRQCIESTNITMKKGGTDTDDDHDTPANLDFFDSTVGPTLKGFAYAPTIPHYNDRYSVPPSSKLSSSSLKRVSTDNFNNHRRGSKDSSDSYGTGLTVDDIIDRLVSPEMGRGDEQMVPIFIIFFRKFMTPAELVQALVKRFENDSCIPEQPTPLQKRIMLVLNTWMISYWSDFYCQRTRNQLYHFVKHLSTLSQQAATMESSMQDVTDTLLTLSGRNPPDYDVDDCWGRKGSDTSELNYSKKKDSGFISSYFCPSTHADNTTNDQSYDSNTWSRRISYIGDSTTTFTDNASPSPQQRSSLIPKSNSINYGIRTTSSRMHSVTPVILNSLSRSTSISCSPSVISNGTPFTSSSSSSTSTKITQCTSPKRKSISFRHSKMIYTLNYNKPGITRSTTTTSSFLPSTTATNRPEFAGGTIAINIWKSPRSKQPSLSPSKPSTASIIKPQTPSSSSSLNSWSFYSKIYASKSPNTGHPTIDRFTTRSNRRQSKWMTNSVKASSLVSEDHTSEKSNSMHYTPGDLTFIKFNTNLLLSTSDQEMAEQMTWIEAELFENIESREFVRMIWANNNNKQQPRTRHDSMTSLSPGEHDDQQSGTSRCMKKCGLLASISHFNFVSAWVITMVVMQPKLGKRVALLEKWMTIAVALRDLNNYNTLMAILAGINNAALIRLKQTQELIKKKKIFKRFQSLEKLMSSDKSYSSYRMALKASTTSPTIPYLGIHSQDLIALAEANRDIKTDGTIHWEKFRLMGECITSTIQFQQPKHQISPNPMILSWIANYPILTEEEQYQQSTKAEPRSKMTRMNNLRHLWM